MTESLSDTQKVHSDEALTPEERRLWAQLHSGDHGEALAALVDRYLWLARSWAARTYRESGLGYVEYSDLVQLGTVGLLESISRYQPERGSGFVAFASKRVQGAILNGLEKTSELHAQSAYRRRLRQERAKSLTDTHGADASSDVFLQMVEAALGLAIGHMLEGTGMFADEDSTVTDSNGEVATLGVTLRRLVPSLQAAERRVITYHYLNGLSFSEVAGLLKLSRGRVSQIHKSALGSLRQLLRQKGVLHFEA